MLKAIARLFVFVDAKTIGRLKEEGSYPWWSADNLKMAFFRPLAASTHALDHRLWPDSLRGMHFHSVLWYGAGTFLVAKYFRRILPLSPVAGLAALFFALDEAHFMTVHWLSNRSALVALVFSLLALLAFDRWRREGWQAGALWTVVFLGLSLLSAESGLATVAYLVSYVIFMEKGVWPRRLAALLPSAAVVLLWQVFYRQAGFGVTGSGTYLDPGSNLKGFLQQAPKRALLLLLGQFGWQDVALYNYGSTQERQKMLATATLWVSAISALGLPVLRRDPAARFFAFGLLASLVPVCSNQLAGSRLLLATSVGAAGFLATLVAWYAHYEPAQYKPSQHKPIQFWRLGIAVLMAGLHLIRAPWRHRERSRSQPFTLIQEELERFLDVGAGPEMRGKEVIVVNVPSPYAFFYHSAIAALKGQESAARLRLLAPGYFHVEVERIDTRTLLVRPQGGFLVPPGQGPTEDFLGPSLHPVYLYQQLDRAFRSLDPAFVVGECIELPGMTVEPTRIAEDGRPLEVLIRFADSLEAARYHWFQWDWTLGGYRPFLPPALGEKVTVRGLELSPKDAPSAVF